jgi:hypothetical protein
MADAVVINLDDALVIIEKRGCGRPRGSKKIQDRRYHFIINNSGEAPPWSPNMVQKQEIICYHCGCRHSF